MPGEQDPHRNCRRKSEPRIRLNRPYPALKALPDFEITDVCTTPQDFADEAARQYGVPMAFCDAKKLAQYPAVDLVTFQR
jgi:predicted dehydrogenase